MFREIAKEQANTIYVLPTDVLNSFKNALKAKE